MQDWERTEFNKTIDRYRTFMLAISIICLILATACSVLFMKWQDEKGTNNLLEGAYSVCKESRDYFQELSDEHWQMYWDCHNQQGAGLLSGIGS